MTPKPLLGDQVHTSGTACFSQPRPSSPGRKPWGIPNGDRGDILVPSLAAVTKPTSKSDRRLDLMWLTECSQACRKAWWQAGA